MASTTPQGLLPPHPSPEEWLSPSRIDELKSLLQDSARLLKISGHYKSVLSYWIRLQVSSDIHLSSQDESDILNELKPQWIEKNPSLLPFFDDSDIETKLLTTPRISRWCEDNWGYRVETIYLKRKSNLDRASASFLSVESKDLANEIYHRLKAGEDSFVGICNTFTPEKNGVRGSYFKLQPLESFPLGLGNVLGRLDVGSITKPLALGEKFCIVQLDQYMPCKLDSVVRKELLAEQFMLWTENMVHALMVALESDGVQSELAQG